MVRAAPGSCSRAVPVFEHRNERHVGDGECGETDEESATELRLEASRRDRPSGSTRGDGEHEGKQAEQDGTLKERGIGDPASARAALGAELDHLARACQAQK